MDEHKSVFARILETATATSAVVAVVVLASAAGIRAYNTFEPTALEAQAVQVNASDAPVTSTSETTACDQAKKKAAARGRGDTETVITDSNNLNFQDQCVAAILNPNAAGLSPTNPASYVCVGKKATTNESAAGVITETAYPDASVPAGTCAVTACEGSVCAAAKSITPLSDSISTGGTPTPTVSADKPISLPTVEQTGAVNPPPTTGPTATNLSPEGTVQPEATAQSSIFTMQAPETANLNPELSQTSSMQLAGAPQTDTGGATPTSGAFDGPSQPTFVNASGNTLSPQTFGNSDTIANSAPPQNFFQRVGSTIVTDSIKAIDGIRSFFGFSSPDTAPPSAVPVNLGIRG
ncbi:MAG TPA: hypothetical protein VMH91_03670 [Candidatus Paceibacterota bacterium]|nr:hypothetical protein [Candidatus Paceibacterota bacterium]